MSEKDLYATKDAIVWDGPPDSGSGQDTHNITGPLAGADAYTLIDFEALPSGMTADNFTSAHMHIYRAPGSSWPSGYHDTPNTGATIIPARITQDWSEGSKGADHALYTGNAVTWANKPSATDELSARGSQPASGWWSFEVSPIIASWLGGAAKRGIRLRSATDIVFYSAQGPAAYKPFLRVKWGSGGTTTPTNRPPNAPTNMSTAYGSDGHTMIVSATHTDPDGDASTKFRVQVNFDSDV